jgi:Ricin-type beta-trefoil lectin domain
VNVTVKLPVINIGVDDIGALFKRGAEAGPFLIVSRASGLVLDTAFGTNNGDGVVLWPPHGRAHQLWYLRPTGQRGQTFAENGLALDATREPAAWAKPLMWEPNAEPWQRWRVDPSPDESGYMIECAEGGCLLECSEDAERLWSPWLADRHGGFSQQWLLALPRG